MNKMLLDVKDDGDTMNYGSAKFGGIKRDQCLAKQCGLSICYCCTTDLGFVKRCFKSLQECLLGESSCQVNI